MSDVMHAPATVREGGRQEERRGWVGWVGRRELACENSLNGSLTLQPHLGRTVC